MNSGNRKIEIDGLKITEGTSLYDTEYDRVLWVSSIEDASITVKPVTDYKVDKSTGGPPGDQTKIIAKGTIFSINDLKSLIEDGRFEVSP